MEPEHVLIQGIPVPSGQDPGIRMEFSDWATQTPETSVQVSLFIRALQKMYDTPYTDTLSYFQIAGIHGYPANLTWDNSDKPTHARDSTHMLYCTHNLITFPTWHRPYMVLFEQTVYQLMGEVIERDLKFHSDADKQVWINESTKWRLPYWDWALAANKGNIPALFVPETVDIRVPAAANGPQPKPERVSNPLYRYQLKVDKKPKKMGDLPSPYAVENVTQSDGTILPWGECSGTSRWGIRTENKRDWSDGVNNYAGVAAAINSHQWYDPTDDTDPMDPPDPKHKDILKHPVSDLVYRVLSNVPKWANFSSTFETPVTGSTPWEQWLSLEYIHNNLHGFIGGGDLSTGLGHMQNVPAAAFDPVFYMHHCYIDRLLAIWQALYPDSWFDSGATPRSKDTLPPFHHQFGPNDVRYFNSDDVRDWRTLGYQYDVLVRPESETETDYKERIKQYIDRTYQNTGQVLLQNPDKLMKGSNSQDDDYDDYLIDVLYDRYALGGDPYTIHFFLGAVSHTELTTNTTSIFKHPKHVGSVYNFSSPVGPVAAGGAPYCANCAQQHDDGVLSTAQVPLTIPLYNVVTDPTASNLSSLDPEVVGPYLARELSWVAVSTSGNIIPWDLLGKTKIFVLKGKAKHYPEDGLLSDYSNYKPVPEVTQV